MSSHPPQSPITGRPRGQAKSYAASVSGVSSSHSLPSTAAAASTSTTVPPTPPLSNVQIPIPIQSPDQVPTQVQGQPTGMYATTPAASQYYYSTSIQNTPQQVYIMAPNPTFTSPPSTAPTTMQQPTSPPLMASAHPGVIRSPQTTRHPRMMMMVNSSSHAPLLAIPGAPPPHNTIYFLDQNTGLLYPANNLPHVQPIHVSAPDAPITESTGASMYQQASPMIITSPQFPTHILGPNQRPQHRSQPQTIVYPTIPGQPHTIQFKHPNQLPMPQLHQMHLPQPGPHYMGMPSFAPQIPGTMPGHVLDPSEASTAPGSTPITSSSDSSRIVPRGLKYSPSTHSPEAFRTLAGPGAPPCFFFFKSTGGCLKGSNCLFDHTQPPPDIATTSTVIPSEEAFSEPQDTTQSDEGHMLPLRVSLSLPDNVQVPEDVAQGATETSAGSDVAPLSTSHSDDVVSGQPTHFVILAPASYQSQTSGQNDPVAFPGTPYAYVSFHGEVVASDHTNEPRADTPGKDLLNLHNNSSTENQQSRSGSTQVSVSHVQIRNLARDMLHNHENSSKRAQYTNRQLLQDSASQQNQPTRLRQKPSQRKQDTGTQDDRQDELHKSDQGLKKTSAPSRQSILSEQKTVDSNSSRITTSASGSNLLDVPEQPSRVFTSFLRPVRAWVADSTGKHIVSPLQGFHGAFSNAISAVNTPQSERNLIRQYESNHRPLPNLASNLNSWLSARAAIAPFIEPLSGGDDLCSRDRMRFLAFAQKLYTRPSISLEMSSSLAEARSPDIARWILSCAREVVVGLDANEEVAAFYRMSTAQARRLATPSSVATTASRTLVNDPSPFASLSAGSLDVEPIKFSRSSTQENWTTLAADLGILNVASVLGDISHCELITALNPTLDKSSTQLDTNAPFQSGLPAGVSTHGGVGTPTMTLHPWSQMHPTPATRREFSALLTLFPPLKHDGNSDSENSDVKHQKASAVLAEFFKALGPPAIDPAYRDALSLASTKNCSGTLTGFAWLDALTPVNVENLLAVVTVPSAYPRYGNTVDPLIFARSRPSLSEILTRSSVTPPSAASFSSVSSSPRDSPTLSSRSFSGQGGSFSASEIMPGWAKHSTTPTLVLNEALLTLLHLRLIATQGIVSSSAEAKEAHLDSIDPQTKSQHTPSASVERDALTALMSALLGVEVNRLQCPILGGQVPSFLTVLERFMSINNVVEAISTETSLDILEYELKANALNLVSVAISSYFAAKAAEQLHIALEKYGNSTLPAGGLLLYLSQLHPRARALCLRRTLPFMLSQTLLLPHFFPTPLSTTHMSPVDEGLGNLGASVASGVPFQGFASPCDVDSEIKQSVSLTRPQLVSLLAAQSFSLLPKENETSTDISNFGTQLFGLATRGASEDIKLFLESISMRTSSGTSRLGMLALVAFGYSGLSGGVVSETANHIVRLALLLHYFERMRVTTVQPCAVENLPASISEYDLSSISSSDPDADEEAIFESTQSSESTIVDQGYVDDVPPRPIAMPLGGMRGAAALIALTRARAVWEASMKSDAPHAYPSWLPTIIQHIIKTWRSASKPDPRDTLGSMMIAGRIFTSNPLWGSFATQTVGGATIGDIQTIPNFTPNRSYTTNRLDPVMLERDSDVLPIVMNSQPYLTSTGSRSPSPISLSVLTAFVFAVAVNSVQHLHGDEGSHPTSGVNLRASTSLAIPFSSVFSYPTLPRATPMNSGVSTQPMQSEPCEALITTNKQEKRRLRQARVAAASARHYLYTAPTVYRVPGLNSGSLETAARTVPSAGTNNRIWRKDTKSQTETKLNRLDIIHPIIEFECEYVPRVDRSTEVIVTSPKTGSNATTMGSQDIETFDSLLQGFPMVLRPGQNGSHSSSPDIHAHSQNSLASSPASQRLIDIVVQYVPPTSSSTSGADAKSIDVPSSASLEHSSTEFSQDDLAPPNHEDTIIPVLSVNPKELRLRPRRIGNTTCTTIAEGHSGAWNALTCDISLFFQPEALAIFALTSPTVRKASCPFEARMKVSGAEFFARPTLGAELYASEHHWWSQSLYSLRERSRTKSSQEVRGHETSGTVNMLPHNSRSPHPDAFLRLMHFIDPSVLFSVLSRRIAKDALHFVVSYPTNGGNKNEHDMTDSLMGDVGGAGPHSQTVSTIGPHLYDSAMEYVQANVWTSGNQHQSYYTYTHGRGQAGIAPLYATPDSVQSPVADSDTGGNDATSSSIMDSTSSTPPSSANTSITSQVSAYRPTTYVHRRVAVPILPTAPLLVPRTLLENVFDPLPLMQKRQRLQANFEEVAINTEGATQEGLPQAKEFQIDVELTGYQRPRSLTFTLY